MDDAEFVERMKERIESAVGRAIDLEIDGQEAQRLSVDLSAATPMVVFGADALLHDGMARMFMQYAILCLREQREVGEDEFLRYLRRN
ncbi:MAG: hypothetical protein IIC80_02690 [Chloroflexi bacterium]|nr:hypothetical protein [Chloroflexota bacterium]